jgi:hypothetical protein
MMFALKQRRGAKNLHTLAACIGTVIVDEGVCHVAQELTWSHQCESFLCIMKFQIKLSFLQALLCHTSSRCWSRVVKVMTKRAMECHIRIRHSAYAVIAGDSLLIISRVWTTPRIEIYDTIGRFMVRTCEHYQRIHGVATAQLLPDVSTDVWPPLN